MSRWFRWYTGTSEDAKFRVTARNAETPLCNAIAVWAVLLEDASHPDHRGVATRGEPFFSAILDLDTGKLNRIIEEMSALNMVTYVHEGIAISHWKERQFETDAIDPTNADRQRRWRGKNKAQSANGDKTARNGARNGTQNGNVTGAKRPDTEAETDTEADKKETANAVSRARDRDFDVWYKTFPLHVGRGQARRAYTAARKKVSAEILLAGAVEATAKYAGSDQRFIPHPATWLNGERWADAEAPSYSPPQNDPFRGAI